MSGRHCHGTVAITMLKFDVPAMTAEQIVAVTEFMNDHRGRVRLEEDEWEGTGVSTLKYIATDGTMCQLHILLGQRNTMLYMC